MDDLDRTFMDRAACKGLDPDLFMPVRGEYQKMMNAKRICQFCPVQTECAEYGLELSVRYDTHGIFGGLTRNERETILKQRGQRMATFRGSRLVGITT